MSYPRMTEAGSPKEGGYLYEMPLLVLLATLMGALLWPWIGEPWRVAVAGVVGLTIILFLWYSSR